MRTCLLALLALCISPLVSTAAVADSWGEPGVEVTPSANGAYRLTVTPRSILNQLEFFEDKVAGREPAGQTPDEPATATARLERRESDGRWSVVWDRPLVNDVAPVSALVSDDGRYVVTFDNWHSVGFGDDVVVIYGSDGALIRSMALTDILPNYFMDGFPRSVSSLHWQHQSTRISGDMVQLAVLEPGVEAHRDGSPFYMVSIRLDTGTPAPLSADQRRRLQPLACTAHRAAVLDHNEGLRWLRSDLAAPTTSDRNEWSRYYYQATERLLASGSSDAAESDFLDQPLFQLLGPGEYMFSDFRDGFREALGAPAAELQRGLFAAIDQTLMAEEIVRTARRIAPGSLAGRDLYFFADADHWPRIAAAMADKGATLHQIDTGRPIPQRADFIAELGEDRAVDPACASISSIDDGTISAVTISVSVALLASMAVAISIGTRSSSRA